MKKMISVEKLHLYVDNPRLPHAETEEEALRAIVDDQTKKLIALGKDIAANGLSPLESLAVFPHSRKGHYFVAEGNRRITAIKLLHNPDLIEAYAPSIAKAFRKIEINKDIDISQVSAEIYESEHAPGLLHVMEQRHLGEQDGVGVVPWNSKQKARFESMHHGDNALLIFLTELVDRGFLTQSQTDSVTKTNWERILRPVGLDFLKIKRENSLYVIPEDHLAEFTTKIRLIADELGGKSVAVVYATEQIQSFLARIDALYKAASAPDDIPARIDSKSDLPSCDGAPSVEAESPIEESTSDTSKHPESTDHDDAEKTADEDEPAYEPTVPPSPYKGSKTVIPKGVRIQSRNARISKIISELKSISVEDYPNACGALLRLLIELSAKEYVEHNKLQDEATKIGFGAVVSMVLNDLRLKRKIEPYYSSQISHSQDEARKLFDGHMHNTDSYPSSTVIKDLFCTFEKFIRLCLE